MSEKAKPTNYSAMQETLVVEPNGAHASAAHVESKQTARRKSTRRGSAHRRHAPTTRAKGTRARGAPSARASQLAYADTPDAVAADAAENILGPNPVVGLRNRDLVDTARMLFGQAARRPHTLVAHSLKFAGEAYKILGGTSKITPAPKDRRFQDVTWQENAFYRALLQFYLSADKEVKDWLQDIRLEDEDKRRAEFVLSLVSDALAPSNSVLNPGAVKRFFETGGGSAARGARHLLQDIFQNSGMPSQVDRSAFHVGENLATTPGAVVFSSDIMELIQYTPTTETVSERPLIIVPPQINKFYIFDLSPKKSLVQYALAQGLQVFIISWRNPTPAQRYWGLDSYIESVEEAIGVARNITRSKDVNLLGACSGGITTVALLGYLAAERRKLVNSLTLLVSMFDMHQAETPLGLFATEEAIEFARQRSHQHGVLEGSEMARVFSWLRPNDLIWNYWVNNYLMGNKPPAFDVLYWNSDTTRLPAALHSDFLNIYEENLLATPGGLSVLGTPIDLADVKCDVFALTGITDHITPWRAGYRSTRLLGGDVEFILSNSGHIQSILNPPGNPDATYYRNNGSPEDPDAWFETATKRQGSWWEHWKEWIVARSGAQKSAAPSLGNRKYPAGIKAPGSYVFQ